MGDSFYCDPIEDPLYAPTMNRNHPHTTNGHGASHHPASYTVREQPLGTPKPLRIVCIGAGVSGINLLRTLRLNLTAYAAVVYEKNADVGGTWFENRYPGCRCDIPSHCYQYSWRPNKEWSNFFAPAGEIGAYLCRVCEEEGLAGSIKVLHQVEAARWDEASGLCNMTVRNLATGEAFQDDANFLINAAGILK